MPKLVVSRLVALLVLGAVVVLPGPGAAAYAQEPTKVEKDSWTLERLLDGFAAMPGLSASFREEKHMSLLAEPLVNEGTLHYSAGKLARHVTSPMRSSVLISTSTLEFGDSEGRETIDLDSNPVVRLFVDSFVHIFAGDRAALERIYAMNFSAHEGGRWTLVLRPKVEPMNRVIDRLILDGEGLVIAKMQVIEVGGDETITTFSKVDANKKYSAKEAAEVFKVH